MARNLALRSFLDTCRRERLKRTPLVSGGRFDRSAIMREAVKVARSMRPSSLTWRECMSIGLGSAWKQARAELAKACAAEPFPIREPAAMQAYRLKSQPIYRPRSFTLGSRATTHGW